MVGLKRATNPIACCEVTLGVTPVFLRTFSYDARSRCRSLVHLFSCVEMEIAASFASLHDGRLSRGSCLALNPPGFPSKISLPSNTNTIPLLVPR